MEFRLNGYTVVIAYIRESIPEPSFRRQNCVAEIINTNKIGRYI